MKNYDEMYESINTSFKERMHALDLSGITHYFSCDYSLQIRVYAQKVYDEIKAKIFGALDRFESIVDFVVEFKKYYVKYMMSVNDVIYHSTILGLTKEVIKKSSEINNKVSELKSEIHSYIERFKTMKNDIINLEQLSDSMEIAKINGEDTSIEQLKEKFKDNNYILSIISNFQIAKHNSKRPLEYIEYEIGTLRILLKELSGKERTLKRVRSDYNEKFSFHKERFEEAKETMYQRHNSLFAYLANSSYPQREFIINSLSIPHEEGDYSRTVILNWVKENKNQLMKYYKV